MMHFGGRATQPICKAKWEQITTATVPGSGGGGGGCSSLFISLKIFHHMTNLLENNCCTDKKEGMCEKEGGIGSYNFSVYWDFFWSLNVYYLILFLKREGAGSWPRPQVYLRKKKKKASLFIKVWQIIIKSEPTHQKVKPLFTKAN